jgi:hypothetical protein
MSHEQTRIHKIHHNSDLGGATTFPLIILFVPSHSTYACIVSKAPIWDGNTLVEGPFKFPTWSKKVARGSDSMPPSKTISAIKKVGNNHEIGSKNHKKTIDTNISIVEARAGHVTTSLQKPHNQECKEESYLKAMEIEGPF